MRTFGIVPPVTMSGERFGRNPVNVWKSFLRYSRPPFTLPRRRRVHLIERAALALTGRDEEGAVRPNRRSLGDLVQGGR